MARETEAAAELRRAWRGNWLRSIEELANLEVQRATWLNPRAANPHYTFVEYCCSYFDDLPLTDDDGGYAARVAEGLLTEEEAQCVAAFHSLFDQYDSPGGDDYDHDAILRDPAWLAVVAAAKTAQERLAALITDGGERAQLMEPSPSALEAAR